jgi:hypothetical protein
MAGAGAGAEAEVGAGAEAEAAIGIVGEIDMVVKGIGILQGDRGGAEAEA